MSKPPAWVVSGIVDLLGLDEETITQSIVPVLESYSSEVRLRGYLENFMGPTRAAQAFTEKYIAFRFPNIIATAPAPVLTPNPDLVKPKTAKSKGKNEAIWGSGAPSKSGSGSRSGSGHATDLESAFGTRGKVYQKQRDEPIFGRSASGPGQPRSQAGSSGTQTPRTTTRAAGAFTILDAKIPKAKVDKADKGKGKEKDDKIWDVPKSAEVKRLEGLVERLRAVRDGEKVVVEENELPCFCKARVHALSKYTPQCSSCGLVLCAIQPAHAPCPSCARPTLTRAGLSRLLDRMQQDIVMQIAHEEDQRKEEERQHRERLLAQSGGGAFPSLPGATPRTAATATRKVLTIGKTKGKGRATATLTTTRLEPVAPKTEATQAEDVVDIVPRPRSPPLEPKRADKERTKVISFRIEEDRPWADPRAERRGEGWEYVPRTEIVLLEEGNGRRAMAKKKRKGLGVNGQVVPGAV